LIYLEDNLYKYGITDNIWKRLRDHKRTIGYDYIVKCWDCLNRTVSAKIENAIKKYNKINNLNDIYKKLTEILKVDNIDNMIDIFNKYINIYVTEYNDKFKSEYMIQKLNIVNAQIEYVASIRNLLKDNKYSTSNININISIDPVSNNNQQNKQNNIDSIINELEQQREYYQKNKLQISEKDKIKRKKDRLRKKEEYKRNKEKILERNRRYYQKNKDNIIDHKRDYAIKKT